MYLFLKKSSQNSVHKARGSYSWERVQLQWCSHCSALPMAAHNISPCQGQRHLLSSSSEQMLPQHNARQVTVTKPRARASCYTQRRFEISQYSWHVNHADPITGVMSTCRRGTGSTGKPLTGHFMNSKNWQAAHSSDMQVLTSALTHHPGTSSLTCQQSGYCPMLMVLAPVQSIPLLILVSQSKSLLM